MFPSAEFLHKDKKSKWAYNLSFLVAHLLVKQGKPFTNGELIKLCLLVAVDEKCMQIE